MVAIDAKPQCEPKTQNYEGVVAGLKRSHRFVSVRVKDQPIEERLADCQRWYEYGAITPEYVACHPVLRGRLRPCGLPPVFYGDVTEAFGQILSPAPTT